MKVLMMHRSDGVASGAQVQMKRICSGLKNHGVDAKILCRERTSHDSVLMPYRPRAERWIHKFTRRLGLNDIHLISSSRVANQTDFKDADLIDIHCSHSGTFSYLSLPALTSRKPTVFTFHDMWPMTGHCHASLECQRWKTGCGKCPHLEIQPPVERDGTAIEWRLKKWTYRRSKFSIVTPSKWLYDQVKDSMLKSHPLHLIPHGVDTSIFRPLGKLNSRARLNIPPGKNVLLCAMESMSRPLKGMDLLIQVLNRLPEERRLTSVLLFFGHSTPEILNQIPIPVIELGYIQDETLKAVAYSAADLFIQPSRAESFGLVALESIACGTPVAAFRVGGLPEVVRHGITGTLAPPENVCQMADHISSLLSDSDSLSAMAERCRRIAVREYSLEIQLERYMKLYENLINGHS